MCLSRELTCDQYNNCQDEIASDESRNWEVCGRYAKSKNTFKQNDHTVLPGTRETQEFLAVSHQSNEFCERYTLKNYHILFHKGDNVDNNCFQSVERCIIHSFKITMLSYERSMWAVCISFFV